MYQGLHCGGDNESSDDSGVMNQIHSTLFGKYPSENYPKPDVVLFFLLRDKEKNYFIKGVIKNVLLVISYTLLAGIRFLSITVYWYRWPRLFFAKCDIIRVQGFHVETCMPACS